MMTWHTQGVFAFLQRCRTNGPASESHSAVPMFNFKSLLMLLLIGMPIANDLNHAHTLTSGPTYHNFNLCSWSHQRLAGNSSAHWARICWGENFELFWLLLPTPRKTFDPPTFLLIVTLIDSRHPKVSIMLCDLTFNISVSRPFPTILPRCLAKSQKTCISLKLS